MRTTTRIPAAAALAASIAAAGPPVGAADRISDGIMDNSFLVEEAYNQEPGVVQHITSGLISWERLDGADDRSLVLGFTQEWPVPGQKHQLSYTIPYTRLEGPDASDDGIGDVFVNYRYQAHYDGSKLSAFAPRLSLILPTGDPDRGLGNDTLGLQLNLPYSRALGDRFYVHTNAGATLLPDAADGVDRQLFHVGASGIVAATRTLHVLLEGVGVWNEVVDGSGQDDREFVALVSPGARYAFNLESGSQLVLGAAAPFGATGSAPDFGLLLYVSFEHRFRKTGP
jgi:hypothetical protein